MQYSAKIQSFYCSTKVLNEGRVNHSFPCLGVKQNCRLSDVSEMRICLQSRVVNVCSLLFVRLIHLMDQVSEVLHEFVSAALLLPSFSCSSSMSDQKYYSSKRDDYTILATATMSLICQIKLLLRPPTMKQRISESLQKDKNGPNRAKIASNVNSILIFAI